MFKFVLSLFDKKNATIKDTSTRKSTIEMLFTVLSKGHATVNSLNNNEKVHFSLETLILLSKERKVNNYL